MPKSTKDSQNKTRDPAVTIYISEETHLELKIASARLGRPMADICREQVTKWLEAYKNEDSENDQSTPVTVTLSEAEASQLKEAQRLINEALGDS